LIRYALTCDSDHPFEGWFGASADFDDQQARGLIACPSCGSAKIRKAIMAPAVSGTKKRDQDLSPAKIRGMALSAMRRVRSHVEENFDDVGDAFASEARAIHEGRAEERGIYGQATPEEVRALTEDGIPVAALPDEPKKSELN